MIARYILSAALALSAWQASAAQSDDNADFAQNIRQCLDQYKQLTEDLRRDCYRATAIVRVYSAYRTAARDRTNRGFDDDFPVIDKQQGNLRSIASAMHWKDFPHPNLESREYMLQLLRATKGNTIAHMKRAQTLSIDHQIARFLRGKFDFERDLENLYALEPEDFVAALKKRVPSVDAFMTTFAMDDLIADAATCPALANIETSLKDVRWPVPLAQPKIEGRVLHPHIVVIRVPDTTFVMTVEDHSMATDVYRWVTATAGALEPCWRDHAKDHAG